MPKAELENNELVITLRPPIKNNPVLEGMKAIKEGYIQQ